jgi:tight adherence protein C
VIFLIGLSVGLGVLLILRATLLRSQNQPAIFSFKINHSRLTYKRKPSDLAITRTTEEQFVQRALRSGVVGGILSVVAAASLSVAGVRIPGFSAILILCCGPVVGIMNAQKKLTKAAAEARRSFSYALSSYLDLVNVLLAGGAGSETALIAAAQTGDNWAFEMIRSALERARAERITQWAALGALASLINVSDLMRVAGSMQLAGEQGSRVRASLAAQADAVRSRQMNEIEAAAQSATERMGVPTVLLFMGFIALLGYPALELVMGSM